MAVVLGAAGFDNAGVESVFAGSAYGCFRPCQHLVANRNFLAHGSKQRRPSQKRTKWIKPTPRRVFRDIYGAAFLFACWNYMDWGGDQNAVENPIFPRDRKSRKAANTPIARRMLAGPW